MLDDTLRSPILTFNLLNWSVVHNGEITSYGTNRRYIESYGYRCSMFTDTEVVAYLFDLLVRRHGLSMETAVRALAPPFWDEIDQMPDKEAGINRAIRLAYGPALMNGPFAIVVANRESMVGFTDRIKLRPLVSGECGERLFISSEEAAIRTMEPQIDKVTMPRAGEPVVGRVGWMSIGSVPLRYRIGVDHEQCMLCGRCFENCPYGVFRQEGGRIHVNSRICVACHRCIAMFPRDVISLTERPIDYRSHPLWIPQVRESIYNQARTQLMMR